MLIAQTTADLIAHELRHEILRGAVPPGSPLRQEALAARFEVSRIPVREALRSLERDGLVEVHPNRGAYVARLSAEQIEELTDLRILIEGDLIARSAPKLSDADLRLITAAAETAATASTTPDWNDADLDFHRVLCAPAQRPQQLALVLSLRRSIARYWSIYGELPARREEWLDDHASLVEACRRRDGAAAQQQLADHIRRAGAFLVDRVRAAETVS